MNKLLTLTGCLILLSACAGTDRETNGQKIQDVAVNGDTIRIATGSSLAGRIAVSKVAYSEQSLTINTTGVVEAIPTAYAEVAAPFAGRVHRSLVRIGQTVKVGTPLYELHSADYSEVVKNYRQSQSAYGTAKRKMDRADDLHAKGIVSDRELEEARNEYQIALEEYRHAESVAKEYQIDLTNATVGQPMMVRSPIAGKVLRNDIVIGEYLKDDAEAKVVVADLAKVWIKANISEQDAPMINDIEKVRISLIAAPDSIIEGKIVYVGGMLDPESRTLQTIIECSNPKGSIMPNMYARIEMTSGSHRRLNVPYSALLQGEGGRYVMRKTGESIYCKTYVNVLTLDKETALVLSGLQEGDEIITDGAFYLTDCK